MPISLIRAVSLGLALCIGITVSGQAQATGSRQGVSDPREAAIRERLLQSGLTPDQIRAQLQAAGYSPSLLDPYLEDPSAGRALTGDSVLLALSALGLGMGAQLQAYSDSILRDAARRPEPLPDLASLEVFGLSVFGEPTSQFLPALAGPVDEGYRLGPGDVLVLLMTGDVELAHRLEVTREGFILIPLVGQVSAANLTLGQFRRMLEQRLARSYSGIRAGTTHFHVTVAQVRMIQVYVIGEVARPASYQIPSVGGVVTALYAAGGPSETGNFRDVLVRRGRDTVAVLDLYDYLLTGSTGSDVSLETGDVVFVPVHGARVAVSGAVVRPALYEMKEGETLEDLLRAAGGFRPDARLERVAVHRVLPSGERGPGRVFRSVVDVELEPATARAGRLPDGGPSRTALRSNVLIPRLVLEDGDSVVVDAIPPLVSSLFVRIAGMVEKPGSYPWRDGLTLRDLMRLARGPTIGADLREAEVARLPDQRGGGRLAVPLRVPLDSSYLFIRESTNQYFGPPGAAFPAAGSAPEVTLEPFDHVTVLKQPEFELQRAVVITGEVAFPGPYALTRKDERMSELVERAGGLLPTAYAPGARLIRAFDNAGRVNIELPQALERPGGPNDVALQPGDSLDVPEYNPTVQVLGAVNAPSSVLYREGAGLDYYISNAGGYAQNADKGRISVRYANGSARVKKRFLLFSSTPDAKPGSVISVPQRRPRPPLDLVSLIGTVAQVVASTATIIVVLTR